MAIPLLVAAAMAAQAGTQPTDLRASRADPYRCQQEVFRDALGRVAPVVVRIETIGGAMPGERGRDPLGRQAAAPADGNVGAGIAIFRNAVAFFG